MSYRRIFWHRVGLLFALLAAATFCGPPMIYFFIHGLWLSLWGHGLRCQGLSEFGFSLLLAIGIRLTWWRAKRYSDFLDQAQP